MPKILAVDDDPQITILYETLCEDLEIEYEIATTAAEAKTLFKKNTYDLILLDLELPDGNGLDLLPEFTAQVNGPEVIIITGTGNTKGAELAFKFQAWDYVRKPFHLSELSLPITRALEYRKEKLKTVPPKPLERSKIIGDSNVIKRCLVELSKASVTDASVLVTGETGTGKELFSQAIHVNSHRAKHPFVVVDCGALPENLVESTLFGHEKGAFTGADKKQAGLLVQANGGTVMLDEIGELPLNAQKTFLRSLQERVVRPIGGKTEVSIDVRIIAATNVDLLQMVQAGTFRQDLYYRIRAIEIALPPLRDREGDISKIAHDKIFELCSKYRKEVKAVSSEFYTALEHYFWPGNVRELINVLEYSLAHAANDTRLHPKHLPPELRFSELDFESDETTPSSLAPQLAVTDPEELPTLAEYRLQQEKEYMEKLMSLVGNDRKQAVKISGISQSRIYDLLTKHSLKGFG